MFSDDDKKWMREAIVLAKTAEQQEEVPVGAVIVLDGELIASGYNQPILGHDPTAHAEIIALRQAAMTLNNYRLIGTTLYTTLEPCSMCAGALVHARVKRLVVGARDNKTGACGSVFNLVETEELNHRIDTQFGLFDDECGQLLSAFFSKRRKR